MRQFLWDRLMNRKHWHPCCSVRILLSQDIPCFLSGPLCDGAEQTQHVDGSRGAGVCSAVWLLPGRSTHTGAAFITLPAFKNNNNSNDNNEYFLLCPFFVESIKGVNRAYQTRDTSIEIWITYHLHHHLSLNLQGSLGHYSLHLFTVVRRSSCGPIACLILAQTSSLVAWSLYEVRSILWKHPISMARILLWSSVMRVHDSQAYRKMNVTRECISCILELRKMRCHSKLVSTLSMLLLFVLTLKVSQAWNPHQIQLSPGTWSFWLSQASVHLLWSLWCCLSSTWSFWHWSPCHRLWRLCRDAQLILPVLLLLLLSLWCHQQNIDWWLFCH